MQVLISDSPELQNEDIVVTFFKILNQTIYSMHKVNQYLNKEDQDR
ncbi:hypothetical protein [Enterococcus pernyi]|nr:hypothetical protein [Enterococcus pernyi]